MTRQSKSALVRSMGKVWSQSQQKRVFYQPIYERRQKNIQELKNKLLTCTRSLLINKPCTKSLFADYFEWVNFSHLPGWWGRTSANDKDVQYYERGTFYFPLPEEDRKEEIDHFVDYYILDDGEVGINKDTQKVFVGSVPSEYCCGQDRLCAILLKELDISFIKTDWEGF